MVKLCGKDVLLCFQGGGVHHEPIDPLQESSRPNHVIDKSEEEKVKSARQAEHAQRAQTKENQADMANPLQSSSRKRHDIDKVLKEIEVVLDEHEFTPRHEFTPQPKKDSSETSPDVDSETSPDVDKLRIFLLKAGIDDFSFVSVKERNRKQYSHILNTKSILWDYSNMKECEDKELYIMTVLHVDDSVDEDVVVKRVLSSLAKRMTSEKVTKMEKDFALRLTEPEIAEKITGYQMGAIPPFGLAEPMMFLFVDEKLSRCESEAKNDNCSEILGIGSGSLEYDLHLSTEHVLRFGASEHLMGAQTCSFTARKKK